MASIHPSYNQPEPITVTCQVKSRIPAYGGDYWLFLYHNSVDSEEHLAIVYGSEINSKSLNQITDGESLYNRKVRGANPDPHIIKTQSDVLTRVHSACFTGETLGSTRCDCSEQLESSMRQIKEEGNGVIIYLKQEGRNIGLLQKLKAYNLQDMGHDTVEANILLGHQADSRSYSIAASILNDLSIDSVKLITNNPIKISNLENDGIRVAQRIAISPTHWRLKWIDWMVGRKTKKELDTYLITKVKKMDHLLDIPPNLNVPLS